MSEETKIKTSKLNKKLLIGAVAIIAIALVAALALLLPKSAEAGKLSAQLDLGDKFLSELNYEQAVVAYLAAIEIDPKNVDALLGLADAYLAQGEYDKAEEVLEDALEELGGDAAETVKDKLEEVREAKKEAEAKAEPTVAPTEIPATSTPVPTEVPVVTNTPTPEPTATSTPTPEPTETPAPEMPTQAPVVAPVTTATPVPTSTPTPTPTVTPTPLPTFTWKENGDGTLTLSKFNDKEATMVTVPEEVDGKKVTGINYYAFSGKSNLTEVILPEGITSIGTSAFFGCSSLKRVNIPSGVTSIEMWTFYDCSSLVEVIIPDGVTSIGTEVFINCSSLEKVILPEGISAIENGTFQNCSSLKEIKIPEGVISIGWSAFDGCSSLKEIQLPDSLTKIASMAFDNCESLETLHIPAGVQEFGSYTGDYANGIDFNPGKSFKAFTVAEENKIFSSVDGSLYSKDRRYLLRVPCAEVGSYAVSESIEDIAAGAFMNCAKITEIVIQGAKLNNLYAYNDTFTGCNSLERFVVEDSTSMYSTLNGMLMVNNEIRIVPNKATGTDFRIPNTVTSIETFAFSTCVEMETVYIPSNVKNTKTRNHSRSHNGYKYDTSEYNYFTDCVSLKEIVVDSASTEYKSVDGVLFTADGATLVSVPCKYAKTTYTVPEGTVNLAHGAFANCNRMTKVTLPSTLVTICPGAFENCTGLTGIGLSSSVKTIGVSAFSKCTSLTELVLPEGVTSIHDYAFISCSQLAKVVVPASVTELGDGVFDYETTIVTPAGSAAERYAIAEELTIQVE